MSASAASAGAGRADDVCRRADALPVWSGPEEKRACVTGDAGPPHDDRRTERPTAYFSGAHVLSRMVIMRSGTAHAGK